MKIILSRKGFDSSYGGFPSLILPDGRLLSLPIPSATDKIKYSDLNFESTSSYYELMSQISSKLKYQNKWQQLNTNTTCHLDPDLNYKTIQRKKDWRLCFGQSEQAQTHLHNHGIKEGDLFLFFGWFRKTTLINDLFQYEKNAPDLHIIYGYLQIDKIFHPSTNVEIPTWLKYHPHVSNIHSLNKPNNTIYIAKKQLTWNKNIEGGGTLKYNDNLILTKKGESKSKWQLPSFFKNAKISYHSQNSWKKEGYFQSAPIGQEFIIEDNKEVENWAKKIIEFNFHS